MTGQVYAPAFLPQGQETPVAFEMTVHAHRYAATVHCSLLSSSRVVFIAVGLFAYITLSTSRCSISLYLK
jgi:hypothetical protein